MKSLTQLFFGLFLTILLIPFGTDAQTRVVLGMQNGGGGGGELLAECLNTNSSTLYFLLPKVHIESGAGSCHYLVSPANNNPVQGLLVASSLVTNTNYVQGGSAYYEIKVDFNVTMGQIQSQYNGLFGFDISVIFNTSPLLPCNNNSLEGKRSLNYLFTISCLDGNSTQGVSGNFRQQSEIDGLKGVSSTFPNPTTDNLTITFENKKEEEVSVHAFDAVGRLVHHQIIAPTFRQEDNRLEMDVAGWNNGIYFIEVQVGDVIETHRVVKK